MNTLDTGTARKMRQMFNPDGVAKSHVTVKSVAAEWTVPDLQVFLGYEREVGGLKSNWRPLEKADLIQDWLDILKKHKFLKGHTYTLFARYRVQYNGKREYIGPHLRRDDGLSARYGNIVKVMEVAL